MHDLGLLDLRDALILKSFELLSHLREFFLLFFHLDLELGVSIGVSLPFPFDCVVFLLAQLLNLLLHLVVNLFVVDCTVLLLLHTCLLQLLDDLGHLGNSLLIRLDLLQLLLDFLFLSGHFGIPLLLKVIRDLLSILQSLIKHPAYREENAV